MFASVMRLLARGGLSSLVALATTLIVSTVQAQGDAERAEALALFEAGVAAYRAQRYDDAIERFEQAYALSPEPVLLYNLARAEDRAGRVVDAVDTYRRYLATAGDIEDRAEIEARVAELEAALAPPEPVAIEPEPPPVPPPSPSRISDRVFGAVALLGAGAATLVVGAVLGGAAQDRYAAAMGTMIHEQRVAWQSEAFDLAAGANTLFVVGSVLSAGGLGWTIAELVLGEPRGSSEAVRVRPLGLGLAGTF